MNFTLAQLEALFGGHARLNKLLYPLHEVRDGAVFVAACVLSDSWLDEHVPGHRTSPPKVHVNGRDITEPVLGGTFTAEDFLSALDVLSNLHHDLTVRFTSAPPDVPEYLPGAYADEEGFHDPTTRNPEWVRGVQDDAALTELERRQPLFASLLRHMLCTRPDWWRNAAALKAWVAGPRQPWTPQRLEDLVTYKDEHGPEETAKHFGMSVTRVNELLRRLTKQPAGHSVFTHRPK